MTWSQRSGYGRQTEHYNGVERRWNVAEDGNPMPARLHGAHVHVSGRTGSDTAGDGTLGKPYATLEKAVYEAPPYSVLLVEDGIYRPSYAGLQSRSDYGLVVDKPLSFVNVRSLTRAYDDTTQDTASHLVDIRGCAQLSVDLAGTTAWSVHTEGVAEGGTGHTVLKKPLTTAPTSVFFPDIADQLGYWQTLRLAASNDLNTNPFSYYHASGYLYISLRDTNVASASNLDYEAVWANNVDYTAQYSVVRHKGRSYVALAASGPSTAAVEPGVDEGWETSWTLYETAPAQVSYSGAYAGGATYALGNIVRNSGRLYLSLANSNTGNPLTDTAKWKELIPERPDLNEAVYITAEARDVSFIGFAFTGGKSGGVRAYQYGYGASLSTTTGYWRGPWAAGTTYAGGAARRDVVSYANKLWKANAIGGGGTHVASASNAPGTTAGATYWTEITNTTTQGTVVPSRFNRLTFTNCRFRYNRTDSAISAVGLGTYGQFETEAIGCRAYRNSADGFNYHFGGVHTVSDCYSQYNGDNGISPHEDGHLTILGGEYSNNVGGNSGAQIIYASGAHGTVDGALVACARSASGGGLGIATVSTGEVEQNKCFVTVRNCALVNCDVAIKANYGGRINAVTGNTYSGNGADRATANSGVIYPAP